MKAKLQRLFRASLAAFFVSTSLQASAIGMDEETVEQKNVGDVLQFGVPLTALAMTFLFESINQDRSTAFLDAEGMSPGVLFRMNGSPRHDLALALGRTVLTSWTLKYGVKAERPNGGQHSFPSGHTSFAFSGAEFIRKEFGWGWGVPAYVGASFVGYSRVRSRNHNWNDVLAGAAIGILSNHDIMEWKAPFGAVSLSPSLLSLAQRVDDVAIDEPRTSPAPVLGLQFSMQF